MIKIFLIGRLGKDCTTNNVNGNNVINFTVAHSDRYKDRSGALKERTIWADCSYWTEKVGVVPYLLKGKQVYIEGSPDVRAYTTNEGKNGASLTIRVSNVQLLDSKNEGDQTMENPNSGYNAIKPENSQANGSKDNTASDDDLPF